MADNPTHGGPRPGSGRPPKAPRFAGRKAEVDGLISDHALQLFENLRRLADGEAEQVTRKYAAAGTVFRKDVVRKKDGTVWLDDKGKPAAIQVPVFPDLPPEHLVLMEEEKRTFCEDGKANAYLLDRLFGKPAEAKDEDNDELDINQAVNEAHGLADAYVDPDDDVGEEGATADATE